MYTLNIPGECQEMMDDGALVVCSHSGGKDSQAMYALLAQLPLQAEQLIVIHATLGVVEWPGVIAHIKANIREEHHLLLAESVKSFIQMVLRRGMWPSPSTRQCTSDLKRGPIERELRRYIKRRGLSGQVISCMGMRAEESAARAKRGPWKFSARNSKSGRRWFEWLPIHDMIVEEVFETIAGAGQKPYWSYSRGMQRLSCKLCIMASASDLTISAGLNPEMYAMYVLMERLLGHTFSMPGKGGVRRWLPDVTGIEPSHEDRRAAARVLEGIIAEEEALFAKYSSSDMLLGA